MTNKLKCPFCGGELKSVHETEVRGVNYEINKYYLNCRSEVEKI